MTDITKEQLETLILIRSLEEFITDEYDNLKSLSEVVWTFEENLTAEDHKKYVEDICKLTACGYLVSDATETHIEKDKVPEVEGITPKGQQALDNWEAGVKEKSEDKEEVKVEDTVIINYSLFGGVTVNNNLGSGKNIFYAIGKKMLRGII